MTTLTDDTVIGTQAVYDMSTGSTAALPVNARDLSPEYRRMLENYDAIEDNLRQIHDWCRAYPLEVFPEPDLAKAEQLLAAGGISLASVSAYAMRHVLKGIEKIAAGKDVTK